MGLLQDKLSRYTEPQRLQGLHLYPYFKEIESAQDTEVILDGKRVLMFGSNSYMGLTNHPKIKKAAIEATKTYGTGSTFMSNLRRNLPNMSERKRPCASLPASTSTWESYRSLPAPMIT